MKALSLVLGLLCIPSAFFAQQSTGANQSYLNEKKEPVIRYSSTYNRMYMLSESTFTPGVYTLDTLDYTTDQWATLSTSINADDFIVEDNGDLTFVRRSNTDIEIFSTTALGQPLWSETSSGLAAPSSSGPLRLVRGENTTYNVYVKSTPGIYQMQATNWSFINSSPVYDLEVNGSNQPILLNYFPAANPTDLTFQIEYYDNSAWTTKLDTAVNTGNNIGGFNGQICLNSNDSIFMAYNMGEFVSHVYIHGIEGNEMVRIGDSIYGSIEEVNSINILANKNDQLHVFFSTLELGPWATIYHAKYNGTNWLQSNVPFGNDYPNHFAMPKSFALDDYNCVHVAYDWRTDIFQVSDTTHSRVRKYCDCEYIADQNTITVQEPDLISNIALEVEYQWLDCSSNYAPINSANDSVYSAVNGGDFALMVSQNGCSDTTDCYYISGLNLNDFTLNNIELSPNPTSDNVKISGNTFSLTSASIFTTDGKLIMSSSAIADNSIIQLNHLPSGTYFVVLQTEAGPITRKIIKN